MTIITLLILILFNHCSGPAYYNSSVKNWKEKKDTISELDYSIYLVGDAGDDSHFQTKCLKMLRDFIKKDSNSAVVFLGDNIYHDGLPPSSAKDRAKAENILNNQLNVSENYKGEIYFIAGNHDWDYMKEDGYEKVRIQEAYIEDYLQRGNTFIPDNGCPGPYHTFLKNNILLIAIDSQWWLHKYEKPYGRCADCDAIDEEDFLIQLEDIIRNNQNKHIIIAAHHPLVSNGNHGGFYPVMDYIFPLRLIRSKWYIPLPVIGSFYPLYRKFGGVDQDIPHYRYQEFRDRITSIIEKYPNVIYAAGHDHNLQYHESENLHHVVSGSGSKLNPVRGGANALYTHRETGFSILKYYKNGEVYIEFWTPDTNVDSSKLSFKHLVYTRKTGAVESYCSVSAIDYSDSTRTVSATEKYGTNNFGEIFLGKHYRKEWETPVKVPLLDLKTAEGGLIPYGVGGGKQSINLKLKNLDDQEFVLRSVNKDPTKAVPVEFRNTLIHEIVEDQISAQHPYGSLTIPILADAIGVLHTNPRLVFIPNDSCLGPYREQFQNTLAIFEEDADEDHSNKASLAFSKNIVGTDRMREKIESDEDNKVDQRNFLRARLLDILIGDWDRHERQFRWAEIKTPNGTMYKAVPEDRDQVYFKFDGLLPYMVSRRWGIRNLKNFDEDFKDIKGLNQSARKLDRRFLTELSREDWAAITDSVQKALTDEVIEKAVGDLPQEVFLIHGPEIIAKLKKRRDQLQLVSIEYFDILSKYVDVFGTDKKEKFIIERINNNKTKVSVYHIGKEGTPEEKIYDRTFSSKKTKEIRLYGLGDEDAFYIVGEGKKGIKLRIIGGKGSDTLRNNLTENKGTKNITYYDTKQRNIIECKGCKTILEEKEIVNYPELDQFFYNYIGPRINFAYNPDDGLFLGGGVSSRRYKFRSNPYGSSQSLMINRSIMTGAMQIEYQGDYKKVYKNLNSFVEYRMYTPQFVFNYFGYGNDSKRIDTANEYYRVRMEEIRFTPTIYKEFKKYLIAGIGPRFNYFKVRRNTNTFLGESISDKEFYEPRYYGGIHSYFKLGTRDNEINPTRGILFTGQGTFNQRLDKNEYYVKLESEFSFYITPNLPFQLTFASRIGNAINYGKYEFYQANALGGTLGFGSSTGNLRGHLRTRFIGDRSFYHNNEIRAQLLQFKTFIFPAKLGLIALFDYGKVWQRGVESNTIHYGYGGGVWLNIFNTFVATGTYSLSKDDEVINVTIGFLF